MESPRKKSGLMGRLLLVLLLALTGWAAFVQFYSDAAKALTAKEDTSLYLAILTQPGMSAVYNPASRKAVLTTLNRRKLPKDTAENAKDLLEKTGHKPAQLRYYVPKNLKRDEYWEKFKYDLSSWRYQPLTAARVLWDYIVAYYEKRTNINPAEFLLLSMDLTRLEITDFTVRNMDEKKNKKKKKSAPAQNAAPKDYIPEPVEDRAPLAVEDRPLIVEILNASGKKGAALELTQYLRDKSQKGLLDVDVLQYDNYPGGKQKETRIVDYSGRLIQVKQLSTAIGINNEIVSEKPGTVICDARIIIGEDFKQPM